MAIVTITKLDRHTKGDSSSSEAREEAHGAQILTCEGVLNRRDDCAETTNNQGMLAHDFQRVLGFVHWAIWKEWSGKV